jgi:cyanophycinase
MKLRAVLFMISLAATAFAQQEPSKGHLVLIGGGEKPPEAMRKFVELAGGPSAPIVVIPTASAEPDTGEYYIELLGEYGCTNVTPLEIRTKDDAGRAEYVAAAKNARGVFFSGGVQSRILDALEDTPVLDAIREAFDNGAVIGGTSAGTACQSPLMITGDGDFTVIQGGAVELRDGLDLFRGVIVDQHFIARQRFNRLMSVTLENPELLGVGIDEATAVWARPDGTFEVIGRSSVIVIDASDAMLTRRADDDGKELLGAHGVRVHVLVDGEVFDMKSRSASREGGPPTP